MAGIFAGGSRRFSLSRDCKFLAKAAKDRRSRSNTMKGNGSKLSSSESEDRPGLLQRLFDLYAVTIGVTPPPPHRQKLVLVLLTTFIVGLIAVLILVGKLVSSL